MSTHGDRTYGDTAPERVWVTLDSVMAALTLLFVIVLPGLAVVGLAVLWLTLLACAENRQQSGLAHQLPPWLTLAPAKLASTRVFRRQGWKPKSSQTLNLVPHGHLMRPHNSTTVPLDKKGYKSGNSLCRT